MRRYPLYIFDLDGTLYRGGEPTPFGPDVVAQLRSEGSQIRFLTNNSGKTREELAEKLAGLGYGVSANEVYGTALGASKVCLERGWNSAFVVGEASLALTLQGVGIAVVNADSWTRKEHCWDVPLAEVVIVGICRTFTYRWMDAALQQLQKGAEFVATNTDATYPLEGGRIEPGSGSLVAAVSTCSGMVPIVVGKPSPYLIEMALADAGAVASDALVIGDRIDTDLNAGEAAGCDTWLVLTGIERSAPTGQRFSEDLRGLLC